MVSATLSTDNHFSPAFIGADGERKSPGGQYFCSFQLVLTSAAALRYVVRKRIERVGGLTPYLPN